MRFQSRAPASGARRTGSFRSLVELGTSYLGTLLVAVGDDAPHDGSIVLVRRMSLSGASDELRRSLVEAAKRGDDADHAHVVPAVDVVEEDDTLGLVSRHEEGSTLGNVMRLLMSRRQAIPAEPLLRIAVDLLCGVGFLHSRDDYQPGGLAPEALYLNRSGQTRLLTPYVHALAGELDRVRRHHERIAYQAPETLGGDGATPTRASDLFSVGVMLWELLQRRRLFAGLGAAAIEKKVLSGPAPQLEVEGLDTAVAGVVGKALEPDPAERYENAADMLTALREAAGEAIGSHEQVAALFEEVLGRHPSVRRVKKAIDAENMRQESSAPVEADGETDGEEASVSSKNKSIRPPAAPPGIGGAKLGRAPKAPPPGSVLGKRAAKGEAGNEKAAPKQRAPKQSASEKDAPPKASPDKPPIKKSALLARAGAKKPPPTPPRRKPAPPARRPAPSSVELATSDIMVPGEEFEVTLESEPPPPLDGIRERTTVPAKAQKTDPAEKVKSEGEDAQGPEEMGDTKPPGVSGDMYPAISDSEVPSKYKDSFAPADSIPPGGPDPDELTQHGAQRQVGRCELFVEIAHGGMATVHLGRWLGAGGFSKTVAVKALHPQFARDPEFVRMFLDEARVVARIRHPNVMPIVDLVDDDGDLFIVMEYVHGVTLAHLLRQMKRKGERMPIDIVLRIMTGVLHGLHAAHEAKDAKGEPLQIIHRDVSPENIMVGDDGYARLIDFGIASALGRATITGDGQVKGKPGYLSPEQIMGETTDRRADVYAAAVVLWQALTGRRLFKGDNMAAISMKAMKPDRPPPSRLRDEVGRELDALVLRGMAFEVDERFDTAEDMAEALVKLHPPATHREVGEWVRDHAMDRLRRAQRLLEAVESAPLPDDAEDLSGPMSIAKGPRVPLPSGSDLLGSEMDMSSPELEAVRSKLGSDAGPEQSGDQTTDDDDVSAASLDEPDDARPATEDELVIVPTTGGPSRGLLLAGRLPSSPSSW